MENKTGKYFKYAIGEIVLVVIGILIALQINNWNENRKLEIIKQNYLQLLLEDFKEEIININNNIFFSNNIIVSHEAYVEKFNKSNMGLSEILYALSNVDQEYDTPTFKTSTTETLKSTGDIKLIPTEIRKKIIELSRYQEYVDHIVKRNKTVFVEQYMVIAKLGWFPSTTRVGANSNIASVIKRTFNDEKKVELIYSIEAFRDISYKQHTRYIKEYEILLRDIAHIEGLIELEIENN